VGPALSLGIIALAERELPHALGTTKYYFKMVGYLREA
jgi:hypothetical protein